MSAKMAMDLHGRAQGEPLQATAITHAGSIYLRAWRKCQQSQCPTTEKCSRDPLSISSMITRSLDSPPSQRHRMTRPSHQRFLTINPMLHLSPIRRNMPFHDQCRITTKRIPHPPFRLQISCTAHSTHPVSIQPTRLLRTELRGAPLDLVSRGSGSLPKMFRL